MRTANLTAAVFLVLLPAAAGQSPQLRRLSPSTWAPLDEFGARVAICGDRALVGAPKADPLGTRSGAAYLYDVATGQQRFMLTPAGGAAFDEFGSSVALSTQHALIGAVGEDGQGDSSGAAYVFDAVTGSERFTLRASDAAAGDHFGWSVAISGGIAIVGAPGDDGLGEGSGSAYVFDAATGQQLFKWIASDGQAGDAFGTSVAISEGVAVVGAPLDDHQEIVAGSVYVFDVSTGQELRKLVASEPVLGGRLGKSVAIHGRRVLAGAETYVPGTAGFGAAYLFNATTGRQLRRLVSPGAADDGFGASVSLSERFLLIGAPIRKGATGEAGKGYLFEGETGNFLFALESATPWALDRFGAGVSISDGWVLVGSPGENAAAGAAYLGVDCNGNGRADLVDLTEGIGGDCNGNAIPDECDIAQGVSLDCNANGRPDECDIDLGSSPDCDGNGVPDECQEDLDGNGIPDVCDCVTSNYCLASGNSNGTVARISSTGTTSLGTADLVLEVSGARPQEFGVFFYGENQAFQLFGEGALCVAAPVYRLSPAVLVDASGNARLALDFGSPPVSSGPGRISPFSTWNFQFWYRDPLGGPAGFNLSDGLEVTFCP